MGQSISSDVRPSRSREELVHELATKFADKCFTPLEIYSLRDVFKSLADHEANIHYVKEDTVARFLELPDVLAASPVLFQMISYIGAFPFLNDAPAVMGLYQMVMVIVIMTERYKRVLKCQSDRTRLIFNSLAVHDRNAASSAASDDKEKLKTEGTSKQDENEGLANDEDDDENEEDLIVFSALESLDINDAAMVHGELPATSHALIPGDNFRKLVMLLLVIAPLHPQENISRYSNDVEGENLENIRHVAKCILASFVDSEQSPGIKYRRFRDIVHACFPNMFNGFTPLFEHFLFSKSLDLSKHKDESSNKAVTLPVELLAPLLPSSGEIMNNAVLSQLSFFLPGSSLFRRLRPLYSGNEDGFSMGSFESKVFNWRAPTILLVRGTRIPEHATSGQQTNFTASIPPRRFPPGCKSNCLTFGVYISPPWRHTHKECFGESDTVLFQLEPVHDVFRASSINRDYVTFTKSPSHQPYLAFGSPHAKPTQAHKRTGGLLPLGPVSLVLDDSFEFGVFTHDYTARGGAFHESAAKRHFDFQDRFEIESLEVWGCGGDEEAKTQAERWAWEAREAEARRKINLGTGDIEADRALLELAGLIGGNRSGGSMV